MPRDALRRDGQQEFPAARGGLRRHPDPPARHRLEGHAGQEKSQGGYLQKNAFYFGIPVVGPVHMIKDYFIAICDHVSGSGGCSG